VSDIRPTRQTPRRVAFIAPDPRSVRAVTCASSPSASSSAGAVAHCGSRPYVAVRAVNTTTGSVARHRLRSIKSRRLADQITTSKESRARQPQPPRCDGTPHNDGRNKVVHSASVCGRRPPLRLRYNTRRQYTDSATRKRQLTTSVSPNRSATATQAPCRRSTGGSSA
jgi:hypothetical protein